MTETLTLQDHFVLSNSSSTISICSCTELSLCRGISRRGGGARLTDFRCIGPCSCPDCCCIILDWKRGRMEKVKSKAAASKDSQELQQIGTLAWQISEGSPWHRSVIMESLGLGWLWIGHAKAIRFFSSLGLIQSFWWIYARIIPWWEGIPAALKQSNENNPVGQWMALMETSSNELSWPLNAEYILGWHLSCRNKALERLRHGSFLSVSFRWSDNGSISRLQRVTYRRLS